MADVEIRFEGDDGDALSAIAAIDAALAQIEALAEQVSAALGDITIGAGQVTQITAAAAAIRAALASVESQADDTARALDGITLGPSGTGTLISSAMTGRVFTGRDTQFVASRGGAPGTDLVPFSSANMLLQNRVFAPDAQYASAFAGAQAARRSVGLLGANDPETNPGYAAAAAYLASRGGGGSGGGPGFFSGLVAGSGWGQSNGMWLPPPFGWGARGMRVGGGMAQFGSLAGLAGFGAERAVTSTLGIAGSAAGGLLGGGALYGLGMLGTMGVGMGTDMAGIGQAAGDIKTVNSDLSTLNQQIKLYGANSREAAQAQAQLNTDLAGFSPIARSSVLAAAQQAQSFKTLFDTVTGPAERTGAQIINQGIGVGKSFLPTIGEFAQQNMSIIQSGLQPLFSWMQSGSGGLGIFTDLEKLFQQRLPTAVHAGSQAFELFMHAVDDAAQHTGGFMTTLDKLFTKWNTPSGLATMSTEIGKMIGLFKTWMGLLGSVAGLIVDVFKPAVGLGSAFASGLTHIVNLTRQWLTQSGTQDVLHSLFAAHTAQLQAVFQVFQSLLPALEATMSAFLQIDAAVSGLIAGPLKLLADLIGQITRFPLADKIIGWVAAFFLAEKAINAVLAAGSALRLLLIGLGPAAVAGAAPAVAAEESIGVAADATTAQVFTLRGALASLGGAAVLGPIAVAAAAVYGLDKAIAAATGFDALKKAWGSAGFGADNAGAQVVKGKNPYPLGTSNHDEWEAGYLGYKKGAQNVKLPDGTVVGSVGTPAYAVGVRAAQKAGAAGGGAGVGASGVYSQSQIYKLLVSQGVPADVAANLATISAHGDDPSGSISALNNNPKTGDYSVGLFQENFIGKMGVERVRRYAPQFGLSPNMSVPSFVQWLGQHPAAQAKIAYSIYADQGYGAWTTAAGLGITGAGYGGGPSSYKAPGVPPLSSFQTATPWQLPLGMQVKLAQSANAYTASQGTLAPGQAADAQTNQAAAAYRDQIRAAEAYVRKVIPTLSGQDLLNAVQELGTLMSQINSIPAALRRNIASASSKLHGLTSAHGVSASIATALGPTAGLVSGASLGNPLDILAATPLKDAQSKWDPLLKQWEQQIDRFEQQLREKTISSAAVATITARISQIKQNVSTALTQITQAAQDQAQQFMSVWQQYTQQFDQQFSQQTQDILANPEKYPNILPLSAALADLQDTHTQQQLQQALSDAQQQLADALNSVGDSQVLSNAQKKLAQDAMAHALDVAQSQLLGGKPADMTNQILSDMQKALTAFAPDPKAVKSAQQAVADAQYNITVNGLQKQAGAEQTAFSRSRSALQTHIDNLLQQWGVYYAKSGANAQQALDDLNALLIANGFSPLAAMWVVGGPGGPPSGGGSTSPTDPALAAPPTNQGSYTFGGGYKLGTQIPTAQNPVFMAEGGLIASPHYLVDMAGRVKGMVGEKGTEIVVPVSPSGRLAGRSPRAGGDGVTVNLSFANGMDWLKQFVQVEITDSGRRIARQHGIEADLRHRSGRY